MTDIRIALCPEEQHCAVEIAKVRRLRAREQNRADQLWASHGDGWRADIEGAAGEMSVAKYLGVYYSGEWKRSDIGARIQVRTRADIHADLPLYPRDGDGDCFVLVVGQLPTYLLRGWILGRVAKHLERYYEDRPRVGQSWFIPARELHSMETLREYLASTDMVRHPSVCPR